eukprot:s94_g6.t1
MLQRWLCQDRALLRLEGSCFCHFMQEVSQSSLCGQPSPAVLSVHQMVAIDVTPRRCCLIYGNGSQWQFILVAKLWRLRPDGQQGLIGSALLLVAAWKVPADRYQDQLSNIET